MRKLNIHHRISSVESYTCFSNVILEWIHQFELLEAANVLLLKLESEVEVFYGFLGITFFPLLCVLQGVCALRRLDWIRNELTLQMATPT